MPANTAVRVMPDGSTRVGTEPWPSEIRELAFELWWLKFHRNVGQVVDYLNALPDQEADNPADDLTAYTRDIIVPALEERRMSTSTIYAWSRTYKWAEEAEKRHRSIAPAIYNQVDQELEIASVEAVRTLIEINRDRTVAPKIRVDAANSILDRTGHTAYVRPSDDGKITGPSRDYSENIAGKSTKELLAALFTDENATD